MAQNAPSCKDTQEVQFKFHDKFVAFGQCGEPRSNVKLLAVSSSRGLIFAGNPTAKELKVILLKDVAEAKMTARQPLARVVPLPSVPNYMSCSSDGNLLAINFTLNGTSLLNIYAVNSFMSPQVKCLYNIRLAPEDYVHAVQLLWNPVLPNNLAVVLSNGGLGMYSLKEGGNFELHSLDKSQQVKCGCWSPKGKQIVLGFPSGKLQQFKPDLTPAKTLVCPPNVHDGPFDTLALQWLSTYQFAAIFLQHGEDCNPSLYIINAPKAANPTYINYYDICYSLNGPRNHQFLFTHIPQWNLLLVCSANGVEVGVMGTTETGDTPTWQQLTLLDEARIELPLSESNQEETFPLGFAYDTSSTHQLTINEQKLPVMPMIHVLGSDGHLLSFNFLNLMQGAVSVCSPPPPVADTSGEFRPLDKLLPPVPVEAEPNPPKQEPAPAAATDLSFAFTPNTVTSTPAPLKEKTASLFSGFSAANSQLGFGLAPTSNAPLSFAATPAAISKPAVSFAGFGTNPSGGNMFGAMTMAKPTASTATVAAAPIQKPLYTVPPTFTPVATKINPQTPQASFTSQEPHQVDDTEPIIRDMIALQIESFSMDILKQKEQTQELLRNIEAPSALRNYAKRLDDLQELNEQASDVDFELDVQGLRQGLNEAYAIVAECRGKLEVYRNPDITRLMNSSSCDPAGRRLLSRLQSYVAANEAQLRLAQQHIDTQWEQFQDVVRRNSKSRMHMPCLEGIYQRLSRLQNMTSDQRIKQNSIKAKLKERGLLQAALLDQNNSRSRASEAVDTLADSILSLSVSQVVDLDRSRLSQTKLDRIRKLVQQQKINIISPQRPDRVGLKSEVILESKRRAEIIKKALATSQAKPATANKAIQAAPAPAQLPKPTASKPAAAAAPVAPVATPALAAPFAFSQSSPFVKTSSVTTTTNTLSAAELPKAASSSSMFGSNFSFNQPAKSTLTFGGAGEKSPAANLFKGQESTETSKSKELPATNQLPKPEAKPFSFAGLGGTGAAAPPVSSGSSTFSFGASVVKPNAAPAANLFSNKPAATTAAPLLPAVEGVPATATATTAATVTTATATTTSSKADPVESLFSSAVNICKPQIKESSSETTQPTNVFGGFGQSSGGGSFQFGQGGASTITTTTAAAAAPVGGGGDPFKGLFGSASTTSTVSSSTVTVPTPLTVPAATPSAPSVTSVPTPTPTTTTAPLATPVSSSTATATTTVSSAATTSVSSIATPAVTTSVATPAVAVPASTTSVTPALGSSFSFSNAFSSLSTSSAPATTSPFGGTFAAAPTATTAASNPFQAVSSSTTSTNIFGQVPKPEASVFGTTTAGSATAAAPPPTGLFASAAAANASPFGSPPSGTATSGGNIFGQAQTPVGFGQPAAAPAATSIFGGSNANPAPFGSAGGSIFGGGNAAPVFGQSVFGKPAQTAQASPTTGGNIFSNPVSPPQPSAFGGSIFGGGNNTSGAGFGSFSQSTPNPGGFGSAFAQAGGASVAQTGFGSPQQPPQQQTPQSTPGGFGAKPVFGGSPAFGASPTFGGAPTFGSPKGFGTFGGNASVASPPLGTAFGAAPAKPAEGNIFETLGGQDSGLSFGNLAQTGNSNAQKPAFGGSSFMNYR